MKSVLIALSLFSMNLAVASPIIQEEILNSWGYETVKANTIKQSIKRIKGFPWRGNQTYYPRFTLRRQCFESGAEASNKDRGKNLAA